MLDGEIDPGCEYCISKEDNPKLGHHRIVTNKRTQRKRIPPCLCR